MKIGLQASRVVRFSEADVMSFAQLSGDCNPIHLDEDVARRSIFGRRIVPGILVASSISAVLAQQLPGPGTIYKSQDLRFIRPVFLEQLISVTVEISEKLPKHDWLCNTTCRDETDRVVVSGEAVVSWKSGTE